MVSRSSHSLGKREHIITLLNNRLLHFEDETTMGMMFVFMLGTSYETSNIQSEQQTGSWVIFCCFA